MHGERPARPKTPRPALLLALGAVLLAATAALLAVPSSAAPVASIVIEDSSSLVYNNTELVVDGSLSGPHAGQVFLANASSLTLNNVTLRFVNTTSGGGIVLTGAAIFSAERSVVTADGGVELRVYASLSARVRLNHTAMTSLRGGQDLAEAGIVLRTGGDLWANDSQLVARPDLRPLIDSIQGTLSLTGCTLGGRLALAATAADLTRVTLSSFGDGAALSASGSTVSLTDSTVTASAGGSAAEALDGTALTVRSTNLTAEDIGVAVRSASTAVLDSVAVVADSFGVAAEDSTVDGTSLALVGAPTSVWSRNSHVGLTATHLGTGLLRAFNGSVLTIDGPTTAVPYVLLESGSDLTLTDASFDWAKMSVSTDSVVTPRWRPLLEFHGASGANPGATVSWTATTFTGSPIANGVSNTDGVARGAPRDGPRLFHGAFVQPGWYGLSYTDGNVTVNTTITAWGPGLVIPLYLDPSLPELSFSVTGFSLSQPAEGVAASINASARLSFSPSLAGQTVQVVAKVDGVERDHSNWTLTGSAVQVQFFLNAAPGTHHVSVEADLAGTSLRGSIAEANDRGNNVVSGWYNASAATNASVKPDLEITEIRFEYVHTLALDPVTGETVDAADMVVFVEIANRGLTAAGPFDVGVAAGVNTTRTSLPGAAALGNVTAIVEFGPYLRPEEILVHAEADIDRTVDESDEANNALTVPALIQVNVPERPQPPAWALMLAIAAAAAVVGLAAWGALALWRPEPGEEFQEGEDEEEPTEAEPEPAPPPPPGPAGPPAAGPSAQPTPPAPQPAPPAPQATANWPAGYYGPPGVYPPPPPVYYPAFAPQMAAQAQPPPAKCPRCGSSQVSYTLYPVRQVVCSACRGVSLF